MADRLAYADTEQTRELQARIERLRAVAHDACALRQAIRRGRERDEFEILEHLRGSIRALQPGDLEGVPDGAQTES